MKRLAIRQPVFLGIAACLLLPHSIALADLRDEAVQHRQTGYEKQQQGDLEGAAALYKKAAEIDTQWPTPLNDLGVVLEQLGRPDEARQAYEQALKRNPDYPQAHANLALIYEQTGNRDKAAYHWTRRYQLGNPKDPWTQQARDRLALTGSMPEGALSRKASKLVQRLQDAKWKVREGAARDLGRQSDRHPAVLRGLTAALYDRHAGVRKAAAESLDRLNWTAIDDRQRAAFLMASGRWQDVAQYGVAALPAVNVGLQDDDPEIRVKANEALAAMKQRFPDVRDAVGDAGAPAAVGTVPAPADTAASGTWTPSATSEPLPDFVEPPKSALILPSTPAVFPPADTVEAPPQTSGRHHVVQQELKRNQESLDEFYAVSGGPFP